MENTRVYEHPPPYYYPHAENPERPFIPINIPSALNTGHPSHIQTRLLPIAIPQTGKGRGAPFMRVNAPVLQEYGMPEQEFVGFIDTLNVVSTASPPLKILDLAGGFVGLVPNHWAQLASGVIQLVAKGGTALMSKSRTDSFISQANRDIFGSRGLCVRLVTTEALLVSIGFPPQKVLSLRLQPDIPLEQQPNFHDRLLQGLEGYVSRILPTGIPPPAHAENLLDKMSADQVAREIRSMDRKMQKKDEKSMKKMRKHDTRDLSPASGFDSATASTVPRSKSLERQIKKMEHDIEKINKKISKDLRKGRSPSSFEREGAELVRKRNKLLEKEPTGPSRRNKGSESLGSEPSGKYAESLLWLLIDNDVSNTH